MLLVVPDRYAEFERTIDHLRRQTAAAQLELVFIVADAARAGVPGEFTEFAGHQLLEFGPMHEVGEPLAVGARAARAPLVVTGEDHSFPEPAWAEELIRAHEGPYAAVGALVTNGNPERLTSWANLFHFHGAYTGYAEPREMESLPGHQTAYKRDVILQFGEELGFLLHFESLLCRRLRQQGHRLLLLPAARVRHVQWSTFPSLIVNQFVCARSFAAARSRHWSGVKRWLYALGSPLLPWLKLGRMLPDVLRSRHEGNYWPAVLPHLVLAAVTAAAGEAAGYALGAGGAHELKFRLEPLDRVR